MSRAWLWSWASVLPSRTRWRRFCSTCTTSSSARTPPWSRSTLSQRCPPSLIFVLLLFIQPWNRNKQLVLWNRNQCFFNVRISIVSQEVGLSLLIFAFCIPFYFECGSKSGSGSSEAKSSCGSGSGSTTLVMNANWSPYKNTSSSEFFLGKIYISHIRYVLTVLWIRKWTEW